MTQSEYFKKSVVRDADGALIPIYHGTGTIINEILMDEFCGRGEDQYGRGFYGSTRYDTALCYTTRRDQQDHEKLGGEDMPNVLTYYLNICNPLRVKAVEHGNLRFYPINGRQACKILLRDKRLYLPLEGESMNPLWDFYDLNGVELNTKKEFQTYIRRLAREYFDESDLFKLDAFWGPENSTEYLSALRDTLGYDGVCVEFDNGYHWIAWFPEQIKLVDNLDPQVSPFPAH